MWFKRKRRLLNLALQGGGAHGAFTWGVLDRLLEDDEFEFSWVSGTSAGALNAVALAHGLATGGRDSARHTLAAIWAEVENTGAAELMRLNPLLSSFARSSSLNGVFSPYSFNPLGFDPLRQLLTRHIDFDAIRANRRVNVSVAATEVATGMAHHFEGDGLTIDAVLASACLPTLHHAVVINGRAYWDGGFSANPDMLTIASESPVGDTLLVLLNPLHAPHTPKSAGAIEDRVNTITFNQPLLRDIDTIVRAQEIPVGWFAPRRTPAARLKRHRFHLIEAGQHTARLGASTKVMPDREVLQTLFKRGREEGDRWIETSKGAVGRRGTVDLRKHILNSRPTPVSEPEELEAFGDVPDASDAPSPGLSRSA